MFLGSPHAQKMKIPSGTQPNDIIKVSGKGMPTLKGHRRRGDLYIKINVRIPKKLNQHQRELLEAFAETEGITGSEIKKKGKNIWEKLTR